MKITDIKPFVVDGGARPWTFVKVETDAGLVGWGDCTEWDAWPGVVAMVEHLTPMIVGRDPLDITRIWFELAAYNVRHQGGLAWKAMAGIDTALWDIKGKASMLRSGSCWVAKFGMNSGCTGHTAARFDTALPKSSVFGRYEWVDDLRWLSELVLEAGYTAIKTNLIPLDDLPSPGETGPAKIGNDATPNVIANAVGVVGTFREALGPDTGIALDVGLKYKLGGAIDLARALEPYNLMWLETETFDPGALRTVRESTRTRICTGESLFGLDGYRPFLERYAQDVIMPDFAWNGITMGRKVCDLALAYDTFIAPHNCHGPICSLVSANVASTCPNFMILGN